MYIDIRNSVFKIKDLRLHSNAGGGRNMCHIGFGHTSQVVGI